MNRALECFIDNKSIVYCIFILLIPLTMPLFAPFEYTHMYCIINYNCVCKLFLYLSTYLDIYLPRLPLYYFEYMYLYAEKIVCSSSYLVGFVNSLVIISIILPKPLHAIVK